MYKAKKHHIFYTQDRDKSEISSNNNDQSIKSSLSKKTEALIKSEEFRTSWLRLSRTKNVGARTFKHLLQLFKTPQNAIAQLPEICKRGGGKKVSIPSTSTIEKEIEDTQKFGAKILLACDQEYPNLLAQIHDAPPLLVVKGNADLLQKRQIAVVGARNASVNGCVLSKMFATAIGEAGYIVTSGLACGIDASAHSAALKFGTIGVIAGGIDNIYPKENTQLYKQMYERGLIISEYPIKQAPLAKYFPQRNRIIAGLSIATLVVEAADRSGTLITARLAIEYGRDVFAIPGSPLDQRAHGTNNLIRNGAVLVQKVEDILEMLSNNVRYIFNKDSDDSPSIFDVYRGNYCSNVANYAVTDDDTSLLDMHNKHYADYRSSLPSEAELNKYRKLLLSKLSFSPVKLDSLENMLSNIPKKIMNLLLLELAIAGRIEYLHNNSVCLIKDD